MCRALPIDEAGPFLIELANLRGGPDNITARHRPSGGDPRLGSAALGRASDASLTGSAVAGPRPGPEACRGRSALLVRLPAGRQLCSLLRPMAGRPGRRSSSRPPLISHRGRAWSGLYLLHAASGGRPAGVPDAPTRASVYRQYPIRDRRRPDRPLDEDLPAAQGTTRGRDWLVDWPGYKLQAEAAASHGRRRPRRVPPSLPGAGPAGPRSQHRPKEEAFRPKWESTGHCFPVRGGRAALPPLQ